VATYYATVIDEQATEIFVVGSAMILYYSIKITVVEAYNYQGIK